MFVISVLGRLVDETLHKSFPSSPLENCIMNGRPLVAEYENENLNDYVKNLDAFPNYECPNSEI